jgi:UDPglucose 6-dehydrogenase
MESIGIIGLGYVGAAIYESFFPLVGEVSIIIRDPKAGYDTSYDKFKDCDGIFVCVPTPRTEDGKCDTSVLKDVLCNLKNINFNGVIISKCTATPDEYTLLQAEFPNLVHVPEFLTANNAQADYVNSKFAIIGGNVKAYVKEAERLIKISQPSIQDIAMCSIEEAALAKYTINSFLATKVVFMNEIARLAESMNIDFSHVARLIKLDSRIGNSHLKVPGPDGSYGFGGHCFPKDTEALLHLSKEKNETMQVLEAAIKKNTLLRLTNSK